jgi:hypothetical protein
MTLLSPTSTLPAFVVAGALSSVTSTVTLRPRYPSFPVSGVLSPASTLTAFFIAGALSSLTSAVTLRPGCPSFSVSGVLSPASTLTAFSLEGALSCFVSAVTNVTCCPAMTFSSELGFTTGFWKRGVGAARLGGILFSAVDICCFGNITRGSVGFCYGNSTRN